MTPDSNIPVGPTKLLPCPFCGQSDAMAIWTNHEMCECEEDEGNALSYAVVCDASKPKGKGGCGGSAGFQASEAKAIEVWNRRAVLNAAPKAPADETSDSSSVHSSVSVSPPAAALGHTEAQATAVDVEDLSDLIFNPMLGAGIELHKRIAAIIAERNALRCLCLRAANAINWHLEPDSPDEHEALWRELLNAASAASPQAAAAGNSARPDEPNEGVEAASPQGSATAPIGYGCFFPDGTLEPDLCSTNIKDCEFWRDADDAREKWTVKALYAAP